MKNKVTVVWRLDQMTNHWHLTAEFLLLSQTTVFLLLHFPYIIFSGKGGYSCVTGGVLSFQHSWNHAFMSIGNVQKTVLYVFDISLLYRFGIKKSFIIFLWFLRRLGSCEEGKEAMSSQARYFVIFTSRKFCSSFSSPHLCRIPTLRSRV